MASRSNIKKKDKEKNTTSRRRIVLVTAVVLGVLLVGAGALFGATLLGPVLPVVPVTRVTVEGSQRMSPAEVSTLLGLHGRNLLLVDLEGIVRRLKDSPWVGEVRVRKEYPEGVRVFIEEKRPVALLEMDGRLHYVDASGQVIVPMSGDDVPFLPFVSGHGEGPLEESVLELISVVRDRGVLERVGSFEIIARDPRNLEVAVDGVLIRLGRDDFEEKIDHWFTIEPEIVKRKVDVDSVDLRYANKVVVKPYIQPSKGKSPKGGATRKSI